MVKRELKGNLLSPLPVVLVGAMVKKRPNYLVIGYISPFDFGRYIFFSLYKKRYTSVGIHENKTFSVNVPSESLLAKTNICGTKSGRDFDKGSLFDTFFGDLKTAPMIRECPINVECEVTEILDYDPNEGIIGRVVKSYVNPECLTDEKLDMRKVRPIIWATGGDFNYYRLGERISQDGGEQDADSN
ncbi:MAG: flavin reductase family protein [Candidatus Zixiibacteriota bacterium]|nr:MAG: flavin reductase family protein [candidate division Zixibacteria bacterium]